MPQITPPPTVAAGLSFLRADGISHTFGDRAVLRDVTLLASPGERVGLVGDNGSGKTTLLRICAGALAPDLGSVAGPARAGFVHQQLRYPSGTTVADVREDAVADARAIEHRLALLGERMAAGDSDTATAWDAAIHEADVAAIWSVDARLSETCAALGVDHLPPGALVAHLSGGQRARLGLAHLLVRRPWLALLDEPTNHCDDDALDFIAAQLRDWRGPVVFASHDRVFLDDVATRIVDLDPAMALHRDAGDIAGAQGATHTGSYTDHRRRRLLDRRRWEERYAAEQEQIASLRAASKVKERDIFHTSGPKSEQRGAKKFYSDKASTTLTRRVRNATRRLERAESDQVRKPPPPLRFAGLPGGKAVSGRLLSACTVAVADRLPITSLDVDAGRPLLVSGPNGCGKSTLLAVLAGRLAPTRGQVLKGPGVRVGLLTQDVAWDDASATPAALFRDGPTPADLGLLAPRDLHRPVGVLSGGQQRRVQLALLLVHTPEVLLLDEPTNHMSLSLVEELEEALGHHPGALVVASHDRWLRQRWTGTHVALR